MRLTPTARAVIRQTAQEVFGDDAVVKLFGSRLDDRQRGGDIDLLIELPQPQEGARQRSLRMAALLQMRMGDQPIDILLIDPQTQLHAIHRMAQATSERI
ncbi:MAG: nucleotidyltransferase domain-containing protein [Gammaproteobacteria bacterium]|nr:nucleotidyltransferase domain-containing protein [Gammaproteobacteria bacterium]MBU1653708.1 nucleotidyltransferase domain-containing protein [Gammaproteobacteria bacterium]MBU1962532.1 nucleotidyltransferase domain-containing protein [Gammaproteobacteria bacterium]